MSGPAPNFAYRISDQGVIAAPSAESAEAMLRDLWKNVQPWLNAPVILVEELPDVRL